MSEPELKEKINALIKNLKHDLPNGRDISLGHESIEAAMELAKIGQPAINPLKTATYDSTDAYIALGLMHHEEATFFLYIELSNYVVANQGHFGYNREFEAIIKGAGYSQDPQSLNLLRKIVDATKDASIYKAAIEAIKQIEDASKVN